MEWLDSALIPCSYWGTNFPFTGMLPMNMYMQPVQTSAFPQLEETTLPALFTPTSDTHSDSAFKWTTNEDKLLIQLTATYGPDWSKLANYFPSKTSSSLKKRWVNRLNPSINKTRWSKEEDELIIKMYNQLGGNWKLMSDSLVGRPPTVIKNHFYGALKRRAAPSKLAEMKGFSKLAEDSVVSSFLVNSEGENDEEFDLLSLKLPNVALEGLSAVEKEDRLRQLHRRIASIESILKKAQQKIRKLDEQINVKLEM
jgi:hypothetical protein